MPLGIQEYLKNVVRTTVDKLPLITLTENDGLVQKACATVLQAFHDIVPPYASATFKRVTREGGCIENDMYASLCPRLLFLGSNML